MVHVALFRLTNPEPLTKDRDETWSQSVCIGDISTLTHEGDGARGVKQSDRRMCATRKTERHRPETFVSRVVPLKRFEIRGLKRLSLDLMTRTICILMRFPSSTITLSPNSTPIVATYRSGKPP